MIKELTKYYSDIDFGQQFYTKEEAEDFEKTYKPFYDLCDETDIKWDSMRVHPEVYENSADYMAKEYFDMAKELLDKWLDNEYNAKIVGVTQLERLRNIECNKNDISYVVSLFEGTERWGIISNLFDNIYCIKMRY